ncbi:MAG: hypothetical protein ACI8Q6_002615 [Granulosicoccus sp.]
MIVWFSMAQGARWYFQSKMFFHFSQVLQYLYLVLLFTIFERQQELVEQVQRPHCLLTPRQSKPYAANGQFEINQNRLG